MDKKIRNVICIATVFILAIFTQAINAQATNISGDTLQHAEIKNYFEPGDVSEELGILMPELKRIKLIAGSRKEYIRLDSLTRDANMHIDTISADLLENIDNYSLNSLENKLSEWSSYDQLASSYESLLKARSDILKEEGKFIRKASETWENTLEHIREKNTGTELTDDINTIIDSLQAINSLIVGETENLLGVQKDLATLRKLIQEDIELIEDAYKKSQLSIFQRNNRVIWNSIDSASTWTNFKQGIRSSFRENTQVVKLFFESHQNQGISHLVLFVIFLITFFFINRIRRKHPGSVNIIQKQSEIIFSYPLISALTLSLASSIFIYSEQPLVFTKLFLLAMALPLYLVIPRLFPSRRLSIIVIALISLYFLDVLKFLLPGGSFHTRIVLFIQNLLLIWAFVKLYQARFELIAFDKFWGKVVMKTGLLVIVMLSLAFLGNIIGFLRFSNYIVSAVTGITYTGLLITLLVLILDVFAVFLLEFRIEKGLDQQVGVRILKKVFRITKLVGVLFWIRVILVNLGWFRPLLKWYGLLMDISWTIGPTEDPTVIISMGGIITSFIFILLTFYISKWIKGFFTQDYVILKSLPKGVPAAISMISRYIIVTFGIYIALSFAGIDLGKFGLIAGALGVGIGFGLQNVVYNFVSGLILSVERPIHIGDAIEVGDLMGHVMEVGVRASRVKTFDGSEVIVPNGNLISNQVVNWTLSDHKRRLKILVKTEMGANPLKVLRIMDEEARKHTNTLTEPKPMVLFDGYGSSSLDFTLYFWVYFDVSFTTKSDVALAIYDALEKEGIGMPVPEQKYYKGDSPPPAE